MRRVADAVMGALGRLLVRVFFREIEVEGGRQVLPGVPTVLVANHLNGLVDGLLLMATLRRYPRFLGKSTLFRIAPLWPFLKLAGVVPVYRAKDGVGTDRNEMAFRTCRRLLRRGGLVALFPEGISHDEPDLQPLKTGAARIALGAAFDDGTVGVVIQPVGIVYDDKARFRSVALVRIGTPTAVADWEARYRSDDHGAVRDLTDEMAARLRTLSPSYTSWETARAYAKIAEVIIRKPGTLTPVPVALADRDRLAQALARAEGVHERDERAPLREAFDRYSDDLAIVGLSDAQVAASYTRGRRLRLRFVWSLLKIVLGAPFALLGAVVHFAPYEIIKYLAKKPANEGIKATIKLLGCFASFSILYAGLGVAAALTVGTWAGLVVGIGSPLCGYATVRFSERLKRLGGAVAGYRSVRRINLSSVLASRHEVVALGETVAGVPLQPAPSPRSA